MYEANQAPDMISHIMHSRWAKGVKKQHLQKEKQKQHMFDTCFLVCMHPDSFVLSVEDILIDMNISVNKIHQNIRYHDVFLVYFSAPKGNVSVR